MRFEKGEEIKFAKAVFELGSIASLPLDLS